MRHQPLGHAVRLQLLRRLPQGQGVGLREEVGHELVVVRHRLSRQLHLI